MTNKVESRIDRILGILLRRGISTLFFIFVFGGALAAFTHLQSQIIHNTLDVSNYWPQAIVPLGILIAFSGLMYNRARAVGTKISRYRFRSLYAAERLLAAACYYLAALVCGYFAASTSDFFVLVFAIQPARAYEVKFVLFGPTIVLAGWSVIETWTTVRTIAPNGAFRRPMRVARRVRDML